MLILLSLLVFSFFFAVLKPKRGLACGLYGIASSSLTPAERDMYSGLTYLSCFRGTDSTGCAAVLREKNKLSVRVHKSTDNPVSFIESQGFHDAILKNNPLVLMGHSRAATIGKITTANAHPFKCDHIIGAHNGTINALGTKDKTDSEELYRLIAEKGLKEATKDLSGAYALSFFDTNTKTINFYRNVMRPLHYMNGGGNVLIWASEWRMLNYIRSTFPAFATAVIHEVEPHTHYTVPFGTATMIKEVAAPRIVLDDKHLLPFVPDKKEEEVKAFVPIRPPLTAYPPGYPYGPGSFSVREPVQQETSSKVQETSRRHLATKYVYLGYQQEVISVEDYREILQGGCCNCDKQATTAEKIFFVDKRDYLCSTCQKDGQIATLFMHVGSYARLVKKETVDA